MAIGSVNVGPKTSDKVTKDMIGKPSGVAGLDKNKKLPEGNLPAHAATDTTYGAGSGSNYGHVKLSDAINSEDGADKGVAATPKAVKAACDKAAEAAKSGKGIKTAGDGAAYTATVEGITALEAGVSFVMLPHTVSTSKTPTLDVNALGAKQIRRRLSNMASSQEPGYAESWLAAEKPFRVTYDGTYWIVEGQAKPAAADLYGSIAASKVSGLATVATSGSYNDLENKPASLPANGGNADTVDGKHASEFAAAKHSHSYNDLSDKPTIPAAYSHPATHPASMITGLAKVATSGSYNDLENKPTIPTVPASLPANGGNADTVDNKHASDFMSADNPTGTGHFSLNRKKDTIEGDYSFAEGYNPTADGMMSHAEGGNTTASGAAAHSEGNGTTASGDQSHAEGKKTTASGSASHAEGSNTTALDYQHAQGHYNDTTVATAGTGSGTGSGTAFVIGNGTSSAASNAFRVDYNGTPYAKSALTTTGCDYAEFFEWQDGNPEAEDRRGFFVTLDGEKIKKAEPGDYILGIVSGQPSIIGNGDESWMGRYIMDDFGAFIYEPFEYEEEAIDPKTGKTTTVKKTGTKYKENPDYDPSKGYIQRADRPEWSAVGMLGVLSVWDDGTCEVNGYCKVAEGGTATKAETGYRVIKRVNENIVKVIFR